MALILFQTCLNKRYFNEHIIENVLRTTPSDEYRYLQDWKTKKPCQKRAKGDCKKYWMSYNLME